LKADNKASAASMLARVGRRLDAARLYLLAGNAKVAVEVATPAKGSKDEDFRLELLLWIKQTNKHDLIAALYEALGDPGNAAEHYRQAMKLTQAAECATRAGDFDFAGDLYMQDGKFEWAAESFRRAQQLKKAAQCYEMLKRWLDARELYEQMGDREGVQRCEAASNWL
jgi:tetratricopeptide (TPR) repeat protein